MTKKETTPDTSNEILPADRPPLSEAQARKVGFHQLSEAEADLIRRLRDLGTRCKAEIDLIERNGGDPVWLREAEIGFKTALMCAVRSVAKPDFF